jgi:general secretion pathway protein G
MEIMIVIVIIGLLAGTVTLSTKHFVNKARVNRALTDIATLRTAIEDFHGEKGRYPTTAEGLAVLKSVTIRNDPWGHPYQYVSPGSKGDYDIICYGADGLEGGDGINADLTQDSLGATPSTTPTKP